MKIIATLSLLAFMVIGAIAQVPTYVANTAGAPAVILKTTNSGPVNLVIDCRKQQNLTLQWRYNKDAADNSNVVASISQSIDGINYGQPYTWTTVGNGATTNYLFTNYVVAGVGFLRIDGITNMGAANLTNQSIWYESKISCP